MSFWSEVWDTVIHPFEEGGWKTIWAIVVWLMLLSTVSSLIGYGVVALSYNLGGYFVMLVIFYYAFYR